MVKRLNSRFVLWYHFNRPPPTIFLSANGRKLVPLCNHVLHSHPNSNAGLIPRMTFCVRLREDHMLLYPNSSTKVRQLLKLLSDPRREGYSTSCIPSCYKRWRATLIALMSSAECSQPSHNEICSRRNRPERLGRTLGHMAETAVISMAGGWMLQIGKRLSHPGLWPWWRVLEKDSAESSTTNMIPFYSAALSARKPTCSVCLSVSARVHAIQYSTTEQAELYVIILCFTWIRRQTNTRFNRLQWCIWATLVYYEERESNTVWKKRLKCPP